jgi:hypothetical protein
VLSAEALWAKAVGMSESPLRKALWRKALQVSTCKRVSGYALCNQLATSLRRSFTSREGMTRYILQPIKDVLLPDYE